MIFHVAARARLLRVDKGLVAFTGGSLEFYTGHNQAHQCHNKYYSHHYRDDLSCKKNHDEKLSQMVNVQIARLEFEHFSWVHTTWLSRITPETTAKRPKSLKPTAYNQSPALETKFYRKSTWFSHNKCGFLSHFASKRRVGVVYFIILESTQSTYMWTSGCRICLVDYECNIPFSSPLELQHQSTIRTFLVYTSSHSLQCKR